MASPFLLRVLSRHGGDTSKKVWRSTQDQQLRVGSNGLLNMLRSAKHETYWTNEKDIMNALYNHPYCTGIEVEANTSYPHDMMADSSCTVNQNTFTINLSHTQSLTECPLQDNVSSIEMILPYTHESRGDYGNQYLVDVTDAGYDMMKTQNSGGYYARDMSSRVLMRQPSHTFRHHDDMIYLTPVANGEQSFEDVGYHMNLWDQAHLLTVSFRICMPIAIIRQWHNVPRVILPDNDMESYIPETLRYDGGHHHHNGEALSMFSSVLTSSHTAYDMLRTYGVCEYQRNMVLTGAHYVDFIETGTIADYARLFCARNENYRYAEYRQYANTVNVLFRRSHFHDIWNRLMHKRVHS